MGTSSPWAHPPVDVWEVVTAYLDPLDAVRVAGVCRAWLHLLRMPTLHVWRHVCVTPHAEYITDQMLNQLLLWCPRVWSLDLSACENLTDASLTKIGHHCIELRRLSLDGCTQVTDYGIQQLQSSTNLRHLDMTRCCAIGDVALAYIAETFSGMETLRMQGCHLVTDQGLGCVSRLAYLRSLCIAKCQRVTDSGIQTLVSCGCDRGGLVELDLSLVESLSDGGLDQVLRGCPNLESLSLGGCWNLNSAMLLRLVDLCPHLRTLILKDLPNVTNKIVTAVTELARLQCLDVSLCQNVDDDGLAIGGCSTLRELRVQGCWNVSNVGMQRVVLACPHLETLDVRGCWKFVRGPGWYE